MREISCEIIKDLLPLYYDEVCSVESARLVEEHLAQCQNCQFELDKIKASINFSKEEIVKNNNEAVAIKAIAVLWRRSKVKAFIIGLFAASLLFGSYVGLFQWEFMKVSADAIEIAEVSQLSDSRIVYHAKITDGYSLNRIKYEMDENGNFYLIPLRPIVKTKVESDRFLNFYETFEHERHVYKEKYGDDADIEAIYYRTSGEDVLIWKKGMELKAASDEVKAEFRQ